MTLVKTKYENKKSPSLYLFLIGGVILTFNKFIPYGDIIGLAIVFIGFINWAYWIYREVKEHN